jgi:hypothetical protein
MTGETSVLLGYGYIAAGMVTGLSVANLTWRDLPNSPSRGMDTAWAFAICFIVWPLILAEYVLYGLARAGAWLLPAYRATKRQERAEQRQAADRRRRREVDRLHRELGLPPVDWEPKP